jgi:glycosyltransferase involved in cell wall biosynthesis
MKGDVSVVIPAFKSPYLRNALDSVFSQTLEPLEIIVVDSSPASTLPDVAHCRGRIKYLSQSPKGVSAARNFGVDAANGGMIALLDADDIWHERKLEKQVELLRKNPDVGFSFSAIWNLTDDAAPGTIPMTPFYPEALNRWISLNKQHQGAVSGSAYELLLEVNCIATSSLVIRREAFKTIGNFDESLKNAEDYEFELRLAKRYPAIFISEPTSRYRVHETGLSGEWAARSELFHRTNLEALEKHYRLFPSGAVKRALARTCASCAVHHLNLGDFKTASRYSRRSLEIYPSMRALKHLAESLSPKVYGVLSAMAGKHMGSSN